MRTLTIVIDFDEKEPPQWIWDSHKERRLINGFIVSQIAEGYRIAQMQCQKCVEREEED
jgi:hypothetical protein